ncbi:hypothetical protein [Streptomyces niveus]|uniref:hypothetical protein n=1 Tax=Streptomyces niveus TaxID=193462 RepID=UPI0035D8F296
MDHQFAHLDGRLDGLLEVVLDDPLGEVGALCAAEVGVAVDEARDEGRVVEIDVFRRAGHPHLGLGADGGDDAVGDHENGVVDRVGTCPVDQCGRVESKYFRCHEAPLPSK